MLDSQSQIVSDMPLVRWLGNPHLEYRGPIHLDKLHDFGELEERAEQGCMLGPRRKGRTRVRQYGEAVMKASRTSQMSNTRKEVKNGRRGFEARQQKRRRRQQV